jgi:hypothetical protein
MHCRLAAPLPSSDIVSPSKRGGRLSLTSFARCVFIGLALVVVGLLSSTDDAMAAEECRWFGTRPFCDGQCPGGWRYTGKRESCTSGSRRYCCRPVPEPPRESYNQQCFGQLCLRSYLRVPAADQIRVEVLRQPDLGTHVNLRCPNGRQAENKITCGGRWVSAQSCVRRGSGLGSRCLAWVSYTHPLPRR